MRIDAHQHFWQLGRFPYPWMPEDPSSPLRQDYPPADLAPILERNRFDGSVVVQATTVAGEVEWLLQLADENEFIKGVIGWVDLTSPEVGAALDRLQKHPRFKGVRHLVHDEPDDHWLLRQDVISGLRELEQRGLPYDLLLRPRHLRLIPELVDRVPRLHMVIDHIAKPFIAEGRLEGWAEDLRRVAQIPHVFVKLSGMITEADHRNWKPAQLTPFVRHAVECFGPGRSMFGSDWPVCLLAGSWKAVLSSFTQACGALPTEARAQLLGGTAERFYGISA